MIERWGPTARCHSGRLTMRHAGRRAHVADLLKLQIVRHKQSDCKGRWFSKSYDSTRRAQTIQRHALIFYHRRRPMTRYELAARIAMTVARRVGAHRVNCKAHCASAHWVSETLKAPGNPSNNHGDHNTEQYGQKIIRIGSARTGAQCSSAERPPTAIEECLRLHAKFKACQSIIP